MTIRELYAWSLGEGAADYEIFIQHRDEGGCYSTRDNEVEPLIDKEEYTVTL